MNDSENDPVAALLDGLRPVAPSDELLRRLATARPALHIPSRREKIIQFIPRIATAAALLALASALAYKFLPRGENNDVIVDNTPPPSAAPMAAATPLQMRQRLLGVQDLGVTISPDAQQNPVRLFRARWWDDQTFAPPNGAPPVRQERLRDEIVPVAVATF